MDIADEKYVLLTTTRRNGATVATPVWIVRLPGGGAGFTTDLDSGKVKRIRNRPEVTLQPCAARGAPRPGSAVVTATAEVVTGADVAAIRNAIARKYWILGNMFRVAAGVRRLVRRPDETCGIRFTF